MQYQVGQRVEVRGRGDRCWYMATVTATTPVDDLGAYDVTVQCDDGEILYRSLPADACELRPTEIVWTEADATALRVGRAVMAWECVCCGAPATWPRWKRSSRATLRRWWGESIPRRLP